MYKFNVEKTYSDLIQWIQRWFLVNGNTCNAIIGMSGGKDSTIVAKLMVDALGKDRVIGVMMPDINQGLNDADKICEWLGIKCLNIPIASITTAFEPYALTGRDDFKWSSASIQNIPPRIRMTVLYAVAQSNNGRVINTCNMSENWIGYATVFGDGAGDMSPLHNLTVTEILQLGDYMGIPQEWVHKIPDDGLPNSSPDEEKLGFTYEALDNHIRNLVSVEGYCHDNPEEELRQDKITRMHALNAFKLKYMDSYNPLFTNLYNNL